MGAYIAWGGENGGGTSLSNVQYACPAANGTISAWYDAPNLTVATTDLGVTSYNGYIYGVGGYTTSAQTTTQFAYVNNGGGGDVGSWSSGSTFTTARYQHASTAYNGYIYVAGGVDSGNNGTSTLYYGKVNADGTVSSWATNATALSYNTSSIQPVVANGNLYVAGGIEPVTVADYQTVNIFTLNKDGTATNRLVSTTNTYQLPTTKSDFGMVTLNGYIYVLPGWTGAIVDTATSAAQIQDDSSTGSWTTMSNALPVGVENYKAVTMNGYIYVISGNVSSGATTSSIYYTSAARTTVAGSLDLVGISGKNLAEGGTGGTLTAGNTSIVGTLNVQDAASFNNNMTVAGTLSVGGNVAVKSFTNSTTAFQVQNASGTVLFTVDTSGTTLTIGSGANTVTFASTGEPTLAGTARHARSMVITAEYPGAVLDVASDTGGSTNCSTNNSGTMTSGFATTGRQSYYNWISASGTAQCYDIVMQVRLPSDWAAWNGQSSMMVYNSTGTDSTSVMVSVIDTSGTNDGNYSATAYNGVSSGTTFASTNLTAYSGTYAADGYMTLKIRLTSSSSKNVRVGNITLNYLSKW